MTRQVGIAGPSALAVAAGADVVRAGGNAVDAAVATTLAALCSEVGMVGLDAGAFVTLWAPGQPPLVLDGCIAMPGLGQPVERFRAAARPVTLGYGGHMETLVGYGTVGVGGAVAALGEASAENGRVPWARVVSAAASQVAEGFPLGAASHAWLSYSHREIYGWQADSAAVIHDQHGALLPPGTRLRVPGLDVTLDCLAREGPDCWYRGRLAERIAACVQTGGGLLCAEDLDAYRVLRPTPVQCELDGWQIAAPQANGGLALAAMLSQLHDLPAGAWGAPAVARIAQAQRAVFAAQDHAARRSPSTVHISALDSEGLACAITASSGYGSGVLVPGTGIWLNNSLGELELNPGGFHGLPPGERITSNMTPVAARGPQGATLVVGSPGAERITTALLHVLLGFIRRQHSLEDALAAPRLHVERIGEGWRVALEPGLPAEALDMPLRRFDSLSMFFGGAGAVRQAPDGSLQAAADPRRKGMAELVNGPV